MSNHKLALGKPASSHASTRRLGRRDEEITDAGECVARLFAQRDVKTSIQQRLPNDLSAERTSATFLGGAFS